MVRQRLVQLKLRHFPLQRLGLLHLRNAPRVQPVHALVGTVVGELGVRPVGKNVRRGPPAQVIPERAGRSIADALEIGGARRGVELLPNSAE